MAYSVVNVHDLPAEGPGGAVRFVRRALGAQAFGIKMIAVGAPRGSYEARGPF
jgi:hypothetical protein